MLLSELSLTNFKSFQNLTGMKMKPITVICGANSCGKSTIMQSLLLLKQTFESKSSANTLLMNGKYVRLGNVENIVFSHSLQKKTKVSISFDIKQSVSSRLRLDNRVPLSYLLKDLIPPSTDKRLLGYKLQLNIEISPAPKRKKTLITRPTNVDLFEFSITPAYGEGSETLPTTLRLKKLSKQSYELTFQRIRNRAPLSSMPERSPSDGSFNVTARFVNLLPQVINISKRNEAINLAFVTRLNLILQTIFASFSYIGPLREEPSRRYIYEDEVMEIGSKGENAPYILLDQKDSLISDGYYFDYSDHQFRRVASQTLGGALERWLRAMQIQGFQVESSKEMIHVSLKTNSADRTDVSIADVGFGVSQVFPILLEGLRADKGTTLILEQPEIHLHPKLQMYLADYLISMALSGKGAIVETHSDHMINRFVRRIVEDGAHGLENLIQIYFVRSSESGSVVEPIEIDPYSGIVNWPDEFFDQSALELEAILRAGIERRKQVRAE